MTPAEQQAALDQAVTLLKGTTVGYANHSAAWQANRSTKWWQALDRIRQVRESLDPVTPPPVPPSPSSGFRWLAWDQPVGPNPVLEANSAAIVAELAKQQFMVIKADYTVPVYRATATTKRSNVLLDAEWNEGKALTNCPVKGDWRPSPGDDAHLCVIDTDGCEYNFWGWHWGGGPPYAASATTFKPNGTGFASHGHACRAGGSALTAGLILASEIRAGHIPHALAFCCNNRRRDVVSPATDGWEDTLPTSGARLPIGARIQLDPTVSLAQYYGSPDYIVLRALIEYGAILVDEGGFGFYAEDELTAGLYPGWSLGGSRFLPAALKSRLRVLRHGASVPWTPRQYNGPECCAGSRVV